MILLSLRSWYIDDVRYNDHELVGVVSLTHRLEENGVITDCSIKTLEPEETLDFNFCESNLVNKIIVKVRFKSFS